jgi:hypothetical protein
VVDVEQRALRALEQQVLAGAVRLVERARHVRHQRATAALGERERLVERLLEVDVSA